jgi:hypothetical protein
MRRTCGGPNPIPRRWRRRAPCALLLLLWALAAFPVASQSGGDGAAGPDTSSLGFDLAGGDVLVRPDLQLTVPGGDVRLDFRRRFADLVIRFQTGFNFVDNTMSAEIGAAVPLGIVEPGVRVFNVVDLENTVEPRLDGFEVSLQPTESYISRSRGVELSLGVHALPVLAIVPAFEVENIYRARLASADVLEDATYLTVRGGLELDTSGRVPVAGAVAGTAAVAAQPDLAVDVRGVQASSVVDWRFRERFDRAVSLDHRNSLAFALGSSLSLLFRETVKVDYPLRVWRGELSRFYSLGGAGTIKGYPDASIHALRYALAMSELRVALLDGGSVPLRLSKSVNGKLHRFQLVFPFDVLATQDRAALDQPPDWRMSAGAGLSLMITSDRGSHFEMTALVAQPLVDPALPVVYCQASLFNLMTAK